MDGDDDSFRGPGSPYEHETPVAFVSVRIGDFVSWGLRDRRPPCLWLPETLFDWLASVTSLRNVDKKDQNRLGSDRCAKLEPELLRLLAAPLPESERNAASKVLRRVREVKLRLGTELLIEVI
ncbi:MAG: hypothetical protein ABIT71_09710 [Vicinamibacteraceae bacterium]